MSFVAPNSSNNIKIADATAFLAKMNKLGFRFGPLHLNATVSGGVEADIVPVDQVLDTDGSVAYNCVAPAGSDWHNVAHMVRMWGAGDAVGFRQLWDDAGPSYITPDAALLSVPGATAAINKILAKA